MFFEYSELELKQVYESFFEPTGPLRLKIYPSKQKKKYLVLKHIANLFQNDLKYSEKEVNELLIDVYFDYVSLRRDLIDYKFLSRTRDGKEYWVNENE